MLTVYEFGRRLLEENDLDPLYVMIHAARFERQKLGRYILGYLYVYNTGVAALLADGGDDAFWTLLREVARSNAYPRGTDRRHFRGAEALRVAEAGAALGKTPAEVLDWFVGPTRTIRLPVLMQRICQLRGFGPTIAYKTADMLERLWGASVVFSPEDADLLSPAPRKGAEDVAQRQGYSGTSPARFVSESILKRLEGYRSPPLFDRPVDMPEVETILCKWLHYVQGRYEVGKGKAAQRQGLLSCLKCRTAQELLRAGREAGLWG